MELYVNGQIRESHCFDCFLTMSVRVLKRSKRDISAGILIKNSYFSGKPLKPVSSTTIRARSRKPAKQSAGSLTSGKKSSGILLIEHHFCIWLVLFEYLNCNSATLLFTMVECVDVLMLLVVLLPLLLLKRNGKQRLIQHDSILTGDGYYNELIGGHEETFRDAARMDKPTFGKLVNLLVRKGKLKATQGYCYLQEKYVQICVAQKILIFIYILCGHSQRDTAHRFQHSLSTTSTIIHDVADCILECKDEFIRTPRANDITHDRIAKDPKFKEFEGCLGALDGSHVPAIVRSALHGRFRNRKKFISQNVLGVCDFDMLFT